MSTPPFVDLPAGVVAERWPVRGSHRAVLRTDLAGAREWVVLVPGFTGSKEDFIAVLPILAEAGVGAVAFDLFGQFESDGSDDPRDYGLAQFAADLPDVVAIAARQAIGDPHLLGHSFGGLVVQRAVVDGLRPRSLTLLCSGPGALPPDRRAGVTDLRAALDTTTPADIWPQMPAAARTMSAPVADFMRRRWATHRVEHLRQVARLLLEQADLTDDVRRATRDVDVLVAWGEADDAWPIEVQRRLAADLRARTRELAGCAHSPNVDDPRQLVGALLDSWRTG